MLLYDSVLFKTFLRNNKKPIIIKNSLKMLNSATLSELEHFGNPKYEKLLKSPIINGGKRISSQNVQVSADY